MLVVHQMLRDPAYAERVADRFDDECLAMHARATGPVDVTGRAQLPWPRALGTPPWAVAAQLSGTTGVRHRPLAIRPGRRERALDRIRAAATAGNPVPLYVGSRWLPRHVVLVLDGELRTYDPASGRQVRIDAGSFASGRLSVSGWSRPWFAVIPG